MSEIIIRRGAARDEIITPEGEVINLQGQPPAHRNKIERITKEVIKSKLFNQENS